MFDDATISHDKAMQAVERGSKTLKEANETYHILAGKIIKYFFLFQTN